MGQRWNKGRTAWVSPGNLFDPSKHGVEPITQPQAKLFIQTHHYSHSYPADRLNVGLIRANGAICGVAVFSIPMQQKVIPCYAPGLSPNNGVELGRFVLLDDVGYNGETWFLARAFRLLKKIKKSSVVISYSDPIERRSISGELVKPGHIGTIYKAFNGKYLGRARRRKLLLAPNGTVVSERALYKLKSGDCGKNYTYRQLLNQGAPKRNPYESLPEYINRIKSYFRTVSHPGNHVYAWSLDGTQLKPSKPYPRKQ